MTDGLSALLLGGAALMLYRLTLAPTLSWRNGGVDGGDLVTAAALGGVPHPSGYPIYMLLARLFLWLPLGDEARRLNWLSAVFAALALLGFYALASQLLAHQSDWLRRASVFGAGSVLATTPLLWALATISEVHTLHLFFVVALLWALWRWREQPRLSRVTLLGLLLGLGLGNHLTLLLTTPAVGVIFLLEVARSKETSRLMQCAQWLSGGALGLYLGLLVYAYLPIASSVSSYTPWGNIDSAEAFSAHVGGALYHHYLFALPLEEWPRRALVLWQMALSEFQGWGYVLALVGLVAHWRTDWRGALGLACGVSANVLFAIGYNTSDSFQYLLPTWLICGLWLALGLHVAFDYTRRQWRRGAGAALFIGVCVIGGLIIARRYPLLDVSQDRAAEQFAFQALGALPHDAILISGSDAHTFALWYFALVRRARTDVIIVDQDLFSHAPYRAYLQTQWPELDLAPDLSLDAWMQTQWKQKPIFMTDPPAWAKRKYRLRLQGDTQQVIGVLSDAPGN